MLEPLGAITTGSQFLEPDGNKVTEWKTNLSKFLYLTNCYLSKSKPDQFSGLFPNHIPNPEDKAAMKAITQAVLDNKADLGIIFDTDVDR